MNQTVLCHLICLTAQHFFWFTRVVKTVSKPRCISFTVGCNYQRSKMKTSMMDTEGLIIAWPLTYLPSNSPEGFLLVLQQTLGGQIRAHFGRPPADTTQSNKHGRQDAESRKRSKNDVTYLCRNSYQDSLRRWHQERWGLAKHSNRSR